MIVQYGKGGVKKHLLAAAGAKTVEQFVEAASDSMRTSLDGDFRTFLSENPEARRGLLNRIDQRATESMALAQGNGMPITGNVPQWNGPVPDINGVRGYRERLDRIDAMVDTMGGTAQQRAAIKEQMRARVVRAWLSSVAETNPSAAMAALHSGKYDDVLSIEDDAAVQDVAKSGWLAYEQEIRDSQRELLSNLKTEAQSILADEVASIAATGQSTGMLTDQHKAMLDDGDREALQLARDQFNITRQVASARTENLPAILEALEPQGEGFATEQKRYDFAANLIADRIKKQQNDPAGYAIEANGKAKDAWTQAIASNDPQKIQAAIRMLRSVQRGQGVPDGAVRSITQSSAEHNETLLKTETADEAFGNFVQMRALYGQEFGAILTEMEQAGGVKGWAAVDELYGTGNLMLAKSLARVVHAGEFKEDAQIGMRLARNGMADAARTIFDGRYKRFEIKGIEPTGKSEDTDEDRDQIVQRVVGDAFNEAPSVLPAVREAALSFYVNGAALGAPLDADQMEKAVQAVTGGILTHNGGDGVGHFVAPVPGMSQRQLDTAMLYVKDADLKGAFIGYSHVPAPVTGGMLQGTLQMVSAGNGTYFLRYPGAGLARDDKGLPYEWNLRALLPTLMKRAAGARVSPATGTDVQKEGAYPSEHGPGGVLSNFDPETGQWLGRGK